MQPNERDAGYLWDMLENARLIKEFTEVIKYYEYQKDKMRQLAVERNLEIIGEAAARISDDLRKGNPDIPWRQIKGLRNIIAHEYGEIKYERIWALVVDEIPTLINKLEVLLPENISDDD